MEDYQNCSVLYCVPQLYPVICTLISAVLTGELGLVGLGLVFLCVFVFFSNCGQFVFHTQLYSPIEWQIYKIYNL